MRTLAATLTGLTLRPIRHLMKLKNRRCNAIHRRNISARSTAEAQVPANPIQHCVPCLSLPLQINDAVQCCHGRLALLLLLSLLLNGQEWMIVHNTNALELYRRVSGADVPSE